MHTQDIAGFIEIPIPGDAPTAIGKKIFIAGPGTWGLEGGGGKKCGKVQVKNAKEFVRMFDDLVEKKLVQKKTYPNGLSIFKYKKKVFWDNLWNTDERLLDARGMVLDAEGNKVIWPFTKVFNYQENGTTLPLDKEVIAVRKVNGYLACARWWKGELIVSTTGTLDSQYAKRAKEILQSSELFKMFSDTTFMFEICIPEDPHIVEEKTGVHLIGARGHHHRGRMLDEFLLDDLAEAYEFMRPEWRVTRFGDILEDKKHAIHEGWMIRDVDSEEILMKVKSNHYLSKKALMRMSDKKVDVLFDNPSKIKEMLDEEFWDLAEYIVNSFTKDEWKEKSDQERRTVIEEYFNE